MGSEHYCLRWNNHQSNLLGVFSQLLQDESLVDVTLACDGHSVRAHKVVLSACSSYFQSLFTDHPDRHPIVILKDMKYSELKILLEFMYKGEVNVEYSQLGTLLKTAESLQVKGLAEMTGQQTREGTNQAQSETPTPSSSTNPANQTHPENMAAAASTRPPLPPQPQTVQAPSQTASAPVAEKHVPEDLSHDLHAMSPTSHAKRLRLRPDSAESSDDGEDSLAMDDVSSMPSDTPTPMPSSPRSAEPLPGPSGMLSQIQQVPLSLKKESDWNRPTGDERSTGESSSDFRDLPDQDSDMDHRDVARTYPCMYCGAGFPSQSKLTRHILSHSLETLKYREQVAAVAAHTLASIPPLPSHSSAPLPLKLEALNLESRSHEAFAGHEADKYAVEVDFTTSSEGQANVVLCKFCGKSFPDVGSLIQHLPVHTGDRPFKCEFCGKAFKLRHHMKDHARVHTGERPFKCALCGKTFSRSTILKAHEKTHYPKYVKKFLPPPMSAMDLQSTHSQQ